MKVNHCRLVVHILTRKPSQQVYYSTALFGKTIYRKGSGDKTFPHQLKNINSSNGSRIRPSRPPGTWIGPSRLPGSWIRPSRPPGTWIRPSRPPGSWIRPSHPPGTWIRPFCPPGSWIRPSRPPGSWIRPSCPPGSWIRPFYPAGLWTGPSLPPFVRHPAGTTRARHKRCQILHSRRSNVLNISGKGSNHSCLYVDYLYARLLPFQCKDPTYTLIKVGAALNPGKRLYELDNALNKVVDCSEHDRSTRMQLLRPPKAVIGAAQRDPNFLFLVGIWVKPFNHKSKNPDRLDAEYNVRQTLGWTTGSGFMEAFKQRVRRQEKKNRKCAGLEALTGRDKPTCLAERRRQEKQREKSIEKAMGDCGLSEWVLCRTGTVETVQEAFQAGRLDGSCTNDTWESWQPFVGRLRSVLSMSVEPINVELEFTISGEKFAVKVEAYPPM